MGFRRWKIDGVSHLHIDDATIDQSGLMSPVHVAQLGSAAGAGRVDATLYAGNDLGAKINAADTALDSKIVLFVPGGDYTVATSITPSSGRRIEFGPGTYTVTVSNAPTVNLRKTTGVVIIGSGPATVFLESIYGDVGNKFAASFAKFDNDGSTARFGDCVIADLTVDGTNISLVGSGIEQTISLGNAKNCVVRGVTLKNTHYIGIQSGGSGVAGGALYSSDILFTDCVLDGVMTQAIAAVNTRNIQIIGNRIRGGPISNGAFIDLESNSSYDLLENFVIANNVIDVNAAGAYTWGIFVQGNGADPSILRVGPGVVANNVFSVFDGVTSLAPPIAIGLNSARDVRVFGNSVRHVGNIQLGSCTRCDVRENTLTSSPAPIMVADSTYCNISKNSIRQTPDLVFDTVISESGGSDWNIFQDNFLSWNGGTSQVLAQSSYGPKITLVGANSRQIGNIFGDQYNVDGVIVDARTLANPGESLYYDGTSLRARDATNSDNGASLFDEQVAPTEVQAGSAGEFGIVFTTSVEGWLTALRIYKAPSDARTTHTLRLWNRDTDTVAIATLTTSGESASGWQTVALASPIRLVPGTHYQVSATQALNDWVSEQSYAALPVTRGPLSITESLFVATPGAQPASHVAGVLNVLDVVYQIKRGNATNARETLLTTTNATTVLERATPQQGNYLIAAYYRVVTAATNVTIVVTWDDVSGAQTKTIENQVGQAVGSYTLAPVFINAAPSASIKVTVTAGTANQVVVSATAVLL